LAHDGKAMGAAILRQIGPEWLPLEALRIIESFLSYDKEIERGRGRAATLSGKRNPNGSNGIPALLFLAKQGCRFDPGYKKQADFSTGLL
jgi:hypothetical protein